MAETLSSEHYTETVIDHFNNPRNAGPLEDADAQAFVTNPVCGDSLRLFLRIDRDCNGDRIAAASFLASGCPATIATSSMATTMVRGRSLDEALTLTREDFADAVGGLPKSKVHCSVLAAAAVRNAIAEWRSTHG
ncbi:MAG: iron-sulfur cluster assembly scaffold protein [Chloroflexi bacterium]|nr:iron-sulfur cluster assembly scaffold protein [Chloroflexota bacterium]